MRPRPKGRPAVRRTLALIVAAAMTLALAVMGLILNEGLKLHLLKGKEAELARVADDLARLAARDYDPLADRARMDDWAKEMGHLGSYRVSLIDEDGRLYGDSKVPGGQLDGTDNHGRRPEVAAALARGSGRGQRYSATLGEEYLYAAARVEYQGAPRVLRVGAPVAGLNAARYDFLKSYTLVALAGLLLALGAVWTGSRGLAASFRDLVKTAEDMAAGKLSQRADLYAPGEFGQVAGAINHLAENLAAELARAEKSLGQLGAVLEAMSDGLMVVDKEGAVIRANGRAEEMLCLSGRDRKVQQLRYPELAADHQRVLAGGAAPPRLLHLAGPPEKFIETRFSPVAGESGEAVAVFHDLTERHRLYQMRRDFVANVSHELRTPLTAIMGAVEALKGRGQGPDPLLEILERQCGRLHDLATGVLTLARLEREAAPEYETVTAAEIFQAVAAGREDRFRLQIEPGLPPFKADRQSITGAVENLADNAIKYGAAGAPIILRATAEGERLKLEVDNQGEPLVPEELTRVFERFYRGAAARRLKKGGTGLGLAIVKHAALTHGGEATAASTGDGRVVFTISLPLSES